MIKNIYTHFSFIFVLGLCFVPGAQQAHADEGQIFIDVGQAKVKKSLMAFPALNYYGTQAAAKANVEVGLELYKVIYNDLLVSNFFTFIKPEAFLENTVTKGLKPAPGQPNGFSFETWKNLQADFLIRGGYKVNGPDLQLEVYVYHVPQGKTVLGKIYQNPSRSWRRIAHAFSNDLVKALTGKKGIFNTRFVATRQDSGNAGAKEIYVIDWDGNNPIRVTDHRSIAKSPAWSTDGKQIAYTAFAYHVSAKMRNADLFLYELASGQRRPLSYRKGINSGASFFPDGKTLALTISQEGTPDIFRLGLDGTNLRRITNGPNRAMNVEPAVSPDGRQIAFSSDRSGLPMIYVMNSDGSGVRRVTLIGKYNSSPAWSPDGKQLAFAGFDKTHFDIFVCVNIATCNSDNGQLLRLTDAKKPDGRPSNNESPSWSPDGRHLVFSSDRTGRRQLYIVSPDGTNERRITTDTANWDQPKWSPYLD